MCPDAAAGMGASLAHAIRQTGTAQGWVIALANMPYVQPSTIRALASAVEERGGGIAAPVSNGRRGNPVGFGRSHLDELLQLRGDEGARRLLHRHPVTTIAVDDPGIFRDIDTPADLQVRD